jgi:hypothetical protein
MDGSVPGQFLGLSADYWQAISTFSAPIIAGLLLAILGVKLGGRRLRQELEGQDARRQFLERGLVKLSHAYEEMLGAIRLNYAICSHLLSLQRDFDKDHPAAPRPDDLPGLVPSITDATAFAAIGPSSRIADFPGLGDLATQAFASLFNINLWFLTEIWLPIRGYYSSEESDRTLDRAEAFKRLVPLAEEKYHEAEAFSALPRLLDDLALRTMELGFNSFDDFSRVRKDAEVIRLRNELSSLLSRVRKPSDSP